MNKSLSPESVRTRFLQQCKILKVKQIDISKEFGISRNSVNRWFNPQKTAMPPLVVVLYLTKKYGLKIEDLTQNEQ